MGGTCTCGAPPVSVSRSLTQKARALPDQCSVHLKLELHDAVCPVSLGILSRHPRAGARERAHVHTYVYTRAGGRTDGRRYRQSRAAGVQPREQSP